MVSIKTSAELKDFFRVQMTLANDDMSRYLDVNFGLPNMT